MVCDIQSGRLQIAVIIHLRGRVFARPFVFLLTKEKNSDIIMLCNSCCTT